MARFESRSASACPFSLHIAFTLLLQSLLCCHMFIWLHTRRMCILTHDIQGPMPPASYRMPRSRAVSWQYREILPKLLAVTPHQTTLSYLQLLLQTGCGYIRSRNVCPFIISYEHIYIHTHIYTNSLKYLGYHRWLQDIASNQSADDVNE